MEEGPGEVLTQQPFCAVVGKLRCCLVVMTAKKTVSVADMPAYEGTAHIAQSASV